MFTSKEQLTKKTGPDRIGRYEFLKQLIIEFNTTNSSADARNQTLANLANFAYDPVNYEYLKQLQVIDVFLGQLSEDDEDLLHFALAGLCNISPDPESRDYIIKLNGIQLISNQLLHKREDIALDAIATLYYLYVPETSQYFTPDILRKIKVYEASTKPRYRNLGIVLMEKINENAETT